MSVNTTFTINFVNYTIITITPTNTVALTSSSGSPANWSLTIPSTVTYNSVTYTVAEVGSSAFEANTNLVSCIIPNSVNKLGNSIFGGCTNLAGVTLPDVANIDLSIAGGMFNGCSNMTGITIPSSWTIIPLSFAYGAGFRNVNFSNTTVLTQIVERAFGSCTRLTSITIPDSVKIIGSSNNAGNGTFNSCSSLTSVIFGASSGVTHIALESFQGCSALTFITIPSGVKSISNNVFNGCSALSSITIQSGVTSLGSRCFQTTGLTTVVIPDTVTSLAESAFSGCSNLTGVKLPLNLTYSASFTADMLFQQCGALKNITIPANWNFIPTRCFNVCRNLTKVTFDSNTNLQYISELAFATCKLISIKFPSSLTSISQFNFDTNTLKYILFTGNIPTINSALNFVNSSDTAYYFTGATNTASLSSFFTTSTELTQNFSVNNINYNVTDIDDSGNFYVSITGNTLTTTTDLSIPSTFTNSSVVYTVNNISLGAFQNKSLLTSVTIPNTVTRIDSNAFLGCSSLTTVTFFGNIPSIDSSGNFGITGDTAYYYAGSTNTSILSSFFTNQSQLITNFTTTTGGITYNFTSLSGTNVNITSITPATSITSVSIPSTVTNSGTIYNISDINNFTFSGSTNLTNITVNSYLSNFRNGFLGVNNTGLQISFNYTGSIPEGACSGMNKMSSITIPSTITGIEKNSFQDCAGLKSITIPSSVTSIGYTAFKDCSGLTSIAINSYISNLASGLYGLNNKSLQINFNYTGPIPDGACYRKSNITSITVPGSITSLGISAFEGCYELTNITFQSTQIKIFSNRLFYNCSILTNITIPSSVTEIDDNVFTNCSSLKSITIPSNVTSIGQYAFSNCSGLTNVAFSSTTTLVSIGSYAFQNCTSLTSITIPKSVTTLNETIFKGCTNLTII
jgi:hypothetical protein